MKTLLGLADYVGVRAVLHVVKDRLIHGAAVVDHEEDQRRRYLRLHFVRAGLRFFSIANL